MGSRKQSQSTEFTFPSPPDFLPEWALREGGDWAGLDEFSLLVKAKNGRERFLSSNTTICHLVHGAYT